MGVISMKQLLEAGVHFGHQTRRWNPKMDRYIYTARGGIHIIDLQKTVVLFEEAYSKLLEIAQNGGKVLLVGTKKQAREVVEEEAKRTGQYYVSQRWLGGTLTNFKTIRKSIRKLHDLERMENDGTFDRLTKKEVIELKKEMERLEKFLGGIKEMRTLPEAVFVVDPMHEKNAVLEARKLDIPVFGIVDTNCDPDFVDVIIPGNDDAIRSIKLIVSKLVDSFIIAAGGEVEQTVEETDTKPTYERKPRKEYKQPRPEQAKPKFEKTEKVEKVEKVEAAKEVVEAKPQPKQEAPKQEEQPVEEVAANVDLESMNVADLKALAKEKGLTGYSKLKKAELIEALK